MLSAAMQEKDSASKGLVFRQHGCCFFVFGHKYSEHYVTWKRSIHKCGSNIAFTPFLYANMPKRKFFTIAIPFYIRRKANIAAFVVLMVLWCGVDRIFAPKNKMWNFFSFHNIWKTVCRICLKKCSSGFVFIFSSKFDPVRTASF